MNMFDEQAVNDEMKALHDATLALSKIGNNPQALNRVLAYLNHRFKYDAHQSGIGYPPGVRSTEVDPGPPGARPRADFRTAETLE